MMEIVVADESHEHQVKLMLRRCGLDEVLAERAHYFRLVAVDDGAVVGFLDGLFEMPVPEVGRELAPGVHPGPGSPSVPGSVAAPTSLRCCRGLTIPPIACSPSSDAG
ncbi:hypothetical protein ACQEVB_11740 [Pseudonocardia sp. CA-107938]|uniref:hypothetical protein n=1 Tax=Pseudonocardia sp. CA-107938 TaxID=3240021 RepID=UPI003D8CF89B